MRFLIAFCLFAFRSEDVLADSRTDRSLDGAWALSGKWTGYMGLALKIRGNRYKYWFSSDVGPAVFETTINGRTERRTEKLPKYPLKGRFVLRGDVIELLGSGDYYDRKWHRIKYRNIPCLLADEHYREWKKSGRLADDRLLFKLPNFNETKPQLNYGGFEHSDRTTSPVSP
jgi:hypothetical protein